MLLAVRRVVLPGPSVELVDVGQRVVLAVALAGQELAAAPAAAGRAHRRGHLVPKEIAKGIRNMRAQGSGPAGRGGRRAGRPVEAGGKGY